MGKSLAVALQKGGVGKTTTALALGCWLKGRGKSVCLVDADPQTSLTFLLTGAKPGELSLYDVIERKTPVGDAVVETYAGDFLPASPLLAITSAEGNIPKIRKVISALAKRYDYVIVDTPPGLGFTTVEVFKEVDGVLIVAEPCPMSVRGIASLATSIAEIKRLDNRRLSVVGLLVNMMSRGRIRIAMSEAVTLQAKALKSEMLGEVRRSVAVQEAQTIGTSLFTYAPKSAGAIDFTRAFKALEKRI